MCFFFSSRRRHTRSLCDWSSDVCSSDLNPANPVTSARDVLKMQGVRSGKNSGGRFTIRSLEVLYSRRRSKFDRSEEHTSELQSHSDLVCRLLLEKKKTIKVDK